MDERLQNALSFSNHQTTLSTQRRILKEKLNSSLTYGHNGGIFIIDETLINFLQFLISKERTQNVPLLDSNKNPILIHDVEIFLEEIIGVYFSAVLSYYNEYEGIKKRRTVEKLVDLWTKVF